MQIVALFRFSDQIKFGASFWGYILILVSGMGLGWYGWVTGQRIRKTGK